MIRNVILRASIQIMLLNIVIVALADDFTKRDQELARTVCRVHERAEHIADIIRTEKTLSRRSIYHKEIDLRNAIDDAIIVLQDSIKKRGIDISVDCEDAPKEISTQESQFHQMLVNLIKNSIEAIDELGILNDSPFVKVKSYAESDLLICLLWFLLQFLLIQGILGVCLWRCTSIIGL